jgi:Tol biopolymer transport system component/DNA-binding winged helix-turn-helix (wHTH) protein
MAITSGNPSVFRFGLYELDLQARELRKGGIRIKLQDQPFEILSMLLERPGEVVSREDLQKRLWPADTFVDFDLSLNSAVKKLRQALSDDAEQPRYIETLYRRGYRFIGSLNGTTSQAEIAGKNGDSAASRAVGPEPGVALPTIAAAPRNSRFVNTRLLFLLGGLTFFLAAALLWLARSRPIRVLGYTQITHDGRPKFGMLTDGDRLYLTELEKDHFVIAQVSARGGETSLLTTPFTNAFTGDIAPDGSSLLVADFKGTDKASGVWNLSLPAGTLRRLGDLSPKGAVWLPDGKQLAYTIDHALYIANADTSNPQQVATMNGWPSGLAISPDGRKFRFDLNDRRTQTSTLWEIDRTGSNLRRVLSTDDATLLDSSGKWTRDGRYYVFQIYRNGANNIWVLPEKSWPWPRKPVQLTNGPLTFSQPLPSADGKKIFAIGAHPEAEFVRFDLQRGLVPYLVDTSATDLAFSPDGQWIAYVSIPDETLWRSRIDGSEPLQLSPTSLAAALPRWSPDGKQIVFMARTEGTNYHAYLISASGGNAELLVPGADAGFDPNWSPDGKTIALTLNDPSAPVDSGISLVDVASRKVSMLSGSNGYFSPRYSPYGKYILAIPKSSEKLVLFDRGTQRWADLVGNEIGPKGYPTFSHNGQYVYFDTVLTDDPAFYRIRIADRKLERLFSLSDLRRFQGELGSWTGLTPDDSPLLLRDMSNQEIYALDWETP